MKEQQSTLSISPNGIEKNIKIGQAVMCTKKYTDFKRITGNRMLNLKHLAKLKDSMKQHDLMIPIIVNEKMEVIDGQHRLQARVELGIFVYYVVINGLSIADTQKANANNKNWNFYDFLNFFVEQNYHSYNVLKKFIDKYKFNAWESLSLLGDSGFNMREFYNGEFYIKDLDFASASAEKICQIEKYYKGFKRRGFVLAMINVLKNKDFDFDEFMQKLDYQSSKMVDCTTTKQYIFIIEEIYNYKRKQEDRIRFQ